MVASKVNGKPAAIHDPTENLAINHVHEAAEVAAASAVVDNGHSSAVADTAQAPTPAELNAKLKQPLAAGASTDGWEIFARFVAAGWETFVEASVAKDKVAGKKGWNYSKGIEGMSMGSLAYEMLNTPDDTEVYEELQREYQRGWSMPFVNLSFRKVSAAFRDGSKALGLDGLWMVFVNVIQTLGVPGELIDGIPVQNKWISIVRESMGEMGKQDQKVGEQQMKDLMKNMVTGQMERIMGTPMPMFLEAYGESCGIFKIVIGPRSAVVISDPVIVKHVLQNSQENYTKGILTEVLEPIMGKGLIPADPVTWKVRRRAIVPGFHKQWLQETTDLISECANRLCEDLEKSVRLSSSSAATVNMEEKFTSASLDIIGQAVFNYDFGSVERESPMVRAVFSVLREAERRAQSVVPYWNLPGASSVFRDQKSHEENLLLLNAVLDELLRNAIEFPQEEEGHMSLLQYLVATKKEDVTTQQLRDDLMTLLIAGHETTAALLTWALHELMKPCNQGVLQQVMDELDSAVGDRPVNFEDMHKLPYMKLVLMETLRLYPEPPLLIRRCIEGDEVPVGPMCKGLGDKVSLLPGQDIFISTWSLQRSTLLWGPNANEFDPSRWTRPIPPQGRWGGFKPEKVVLYPNETATDFAFVPFGGGPRKCIGDNFALLEAEVVLVNLLRRFSFTALQDKVGMTTGATIHTTGGLRVEVRRREVRPSAAAHAAVPLALPLAPLAELMQENNSMARVARRLQPEAMVVPTARELRLLFAEQAARVKTAEQALHAEAIETAYEKCREITREYSKTFFLGSQLLDHDEQRAVWAIYNWCRSTDELVDGPAAETTTMADLEAWEERLQRTFELSGQLRGNEGWEDISMMDSIRRFSLIQRPFQDMVGGMAMDLVKTRYDTFQELEVYCYRVAGTVGIMTLPVLGFDGLQNFTEELQEETIAAAQALGMAFQLTNILRDVGEDARRGRIYVPLEDLRRFNISEEEVLTASRGEGALHLEARWRDFMEFQFERCERYYKEAQSGIVGLSEVNRLGVMAALYVYGAILDAVRANKYDNFSRRAYVTLREKVMLMGKAWWHVQELQKLAAENVRSGRIFGKSVQRARREAQQLAASAAASAAAASGAA